MAALISDLPLLVIMNLASGDLAGSTCQGEELSRFYYYNFLLQVCYCEFAVASLLLRVCRCELPAASLLLRVAFHAASWLLRFAACEWILRVDAASVLLLQTFCCCRLISTRVSRIHQKFLHFVFNQNSPIWNGSSSIVLKFGKINMTDHHYSHTT